MAKLRQITETIEGKEYTFQRLPVLQAFELREEWKRASEVNGTTITQEMYPRLLEHIVIKPKNLKLEEFETIVELDKVCMTALAFGWGDYDGKEKEEGK